MRKWRIIFIFFIIIITLTVFNVFGKGRNSQISAETADIVGVFNAASKVIGEQKQFFDFPEVVSQSAPLSFTTSAQFFGNCDLSLTSHAVLARFINQGDPLLDLNSENNWPIASLTKLLTAVIAIENIDQEKSVSMTNDMISADGVAGNLQIGDSLKTKDLIKAMLLVSSNDAAEALAQDFGRNKFTALMNKKAKEIGMLNTFIYDPSGLSARNQSTPSDIFKLAVYIYSNHPDIFLITTLKKDYIIEQNSGKKKTLININEFAGQKGFLGGKTGFTEEAQGNLISVFKSDNQPMVIVVLGSQDRFGETKKIFECVE